MLGRDCAEALPATTATNTNMDETADAMRSVVLRDKDRFKMTEPFRGLPASYTSGSSSTPLPVHLERA